jgi:hypothetical protein
MHDDQELDLNKIYKILVASIRGSHVTLSS